jgi:hypothetical protein
MSTLNVSNITDGTTAVGTSYVVNGSAKAWARYDGNSVLADSFNVSSTVDESTTGETSINLSSNMSDGNYAAQGTCNGTSGDRFVTISNQTASSYDTYTFDGTARTELPVGTMVSGDLA